jgi:uncharacterized membrane protein YfcA
MDILLLPERWPQLAVLFFCAGFVNGLVGFAFSAIAAVALWFLPPVQGVALIIAVSAFNQILMIGHTRRDFAWWSTREREGAMPFIAGGLCGTPLGLALLTHLRPPLMAASLGLFLVAYGLCNLLRPADARLNGAGTGMSLLVGALGGIVGGFSGFPSSVPVVYLSMKGVERHHARAILQPYVFVLQVFALGLIHAGDPRMFDLAFCRLLILCLPAAMVGSLCGLATYRRLSDMHFRRAVLGVLAVSGSTLVVKAFLL